MKLCFSTIGCPDWRFGDMISAAKDLGYTAIEIRGIGGEIYAPAMREFTEDFARTKDMLERTGIRIAMLTSGAALADHSAKGKSVDVPPRARASMRQRRTSTSPQKWVRSSSASCPPTSLTLTAATSTGRPSPLPLQRREHRADRLQPRRQDQVRTLEGQRHRKGQSLLPHDGLR